MLEWKNKKSFELSKVILEYKGYAKIESVELKCNS